MKIDFDGLCEEKTPSGATRWRVRVKGDKNRKITLPVTPEHEDFLAHYKAARSGGTIAPAQPKPEPVNRSLEWLCQQFVGHMQMRVFAGDLSQGTLHQRKAFYDRICAEHGRKDMNMPPAKLLEWLDTLQDTPGAQKNATKAIRVMYAWGCERSIVAENPAENIKLRRDGGGATPWTPEDLKAYRARHPAGSPAHLALTLFMFTACRISDAVLMGRHNEVRHDGLLWLDWQPVKKGSARVTIPVMPPLAEALKRRKVIGPTYLMTSHGKPYATARSFGGRFQAWCEQAGLPHLSSHGIRKAAGDLMAMSGASQYQIMAVHGHTSAKTSEIYTKNASRVRLAQEAMQTMAAMQW